jgi:hypothetical protein
VAILLFPDNTVHKAAWVDADTLWGYVQSLGRQNRGAPSGVSDRPTFDKWLGIART